jgi:CHASE3 domain sensor protein
MDLQHVLDWVFAAAGAVGGWILNSLWGAVKDLQNADKQLAEKVNQIEVLVAGEYATREDFKSLSNAIFTKLDRIEDKLDAKVDK